MFQAERKNKIEFLIRRRFPDDAQRRKKAGIAERTAEQAASRRQEIEGYEEELKAKSDKELAALYLQAELKHEQDRGAIRDKLVSTRDFNQPRAKVDFAYWSKAANWTLDEGVALVLSLDPESETYEKMEACVKISPAAKQYSRIRDLAIRATKDGQLTEPVSPSVFLKWALGMEFDVPTKLIELVEFRTQSAVQTDQEREELKTKYEALQEEHRALKVDHEGLVVALKAEEKNQGALVNSAYWQEFRQKAALVITQYPNWKKTVSKVQKTGNLNDWIKATFDVTGREAEVLIKVLTDFYSDL